MKRNLSNIMLSTQAIKRWRKICFTIAAQKVRIDLELDAIPDEEAIVLHDGSLRVFIPGIQEAQMIVPKNEWRDLH